jgi:hypothetical protein
MNRSLSGIFKNFLISTFFLSIFSVNPALLLFDFFSPVKNGAYADEITDEDRKEFEILLKKVIARSLYENKEPISIEKIISDWSDKPEKGVMRVYATSFGNPGNRDENNYFKDGTPVSRGIVAVALPDQSVTGKWIEVRRITENGDKGEWIKMKVKDLGPWFRDDPYWEYESKIPRAVHYYRQKKRRFDNRVVVNPAGIDITPWGWQKLGIDPKSSFNHSQYVEWRFI